MICSECRRSVVRVHPSLPNMLYRISMVNTYRDVKAFLEYHEYGDKAQLKIWNMSESGGVGRRDVGEIVIFLNYNEVGRFRAKHEALTLLRSLSAEAPQGARKEFAEYFDMIFKSLL